MVLKRDLLWGHHCCAWTEQTRTHALHAASSQLVEGTIRSLDPVSKVTTNCAMAHEHGSRLVRSRWAHLLRGCADGDGACPHCVASQEDANE
jgi:hypothetical protein